MSFLLVLLLSTLVCVSYTSAQSATDVSTHPEETTTDNVTYEVTITPTPTYPTPAWCQEKDRLPEDPCAFCECSTWWGGPDWVCYYIDCFFGPPCVDAYTPPGQCCPLCPNGFNCEIDGHIISMGESYIREDNSVCVCQQSDYFWEPIQVLCFPPKPLNCEDQPTPEEDPCSPCECKDNEWLCYPRECPMPSCMNPIIAPGACCPICPDGQNCEIDGQLVLFGNVYVRDNGDVCYCDTSSGSWGNIEPICEAGRTPTPTPSQETTEPDTSGPSTPEQETTEPDTSGPSTHEQETTEPDTSGPNTHEQETTEPDTTEPESTEPETNGPNTPEQETTEAKTNRPEATEPDANKPETTEPETTLGN